MRITLIIVFIWEIILIGCNSPANSTCKNIIKSVEECNLGNFKTLVYLNVSKEDSISNLENFKIGCELLDNGMILEDSSYFYDVLRINNTVWQETYYVNVVNNEKNIIGDIEIKFINAAGFDKAIALEVNYFDKGISVSPKIEIDKTFLDSDIEFLFDPELDSAIIGKFPKLDTKVDTVK